MARNMLTCTLTGAKRITNKGYLGRRLTALGLDAFNLAGEERFREFYVSKSVIQALSAEVDMACSVKLSLPSFSYQAILSS